MKMACAPQSDINKQLGEQQFLYKLKLFDVKNHKITHTTHTNYYYELHKCKQ